MQYGHRVITPPSGAVVDVDEVLRFVAETQAGLEGDLALRIAAATLRVERRTRRQLLTATHEMQLDRFPAEGAPIELPAPPLTAVTKIEYQPSTGGGLVTWSSDQYTVDVRSEPGRIGLVFGKSYPLTRGELGDVLITYTCGYGSSGTDVPELLRDAVRVLVAERHIDREGEGKLPPAVESICDSYRSAWNPPW